MWQNCWTTSDDDIAHDSTELLKEQGFGVKTITKIELFWNQCLSLKTVGTAHHPRHQRHVCYPEVLMLMVVYLSISVTCVSIFFSLFPAPS